MKKYLMCATLLAALLMASPAPVSAGSKGDCGKCEAKAKSCSSCETKAKECKVTLLKNKLKLLWENKAELGLNQTQLEKIKGIKHAAIKDLIRLNADKDIVMVDLTAAMKADNYDINAIHTLLDAKYEAKKNAAKVFAKAIGDVKSVLSKEQNAKWQEYCASAQKSYGLCPKCKAGKDGKHCPITGKKLK